MSPRLDKARAARPVPGARPARARAATSALALALALALAPPAAAQHGEGAAGLPPVVEGPLAARLTQHITRGPGTMGQPGEAAEPGRDVDPTVRLYPLPQAVEEAVPAARGHRYFIANNRMALVDPDSQRIVSVVPIP